MIRLLYNLLFPLALLVFLPGYLVKMRRRGGYRRNLGQRFGFYSREVRETLGSARRTWMHAVSVGEVAIALKLAKQMRELDPSFACVLTTTTTTGFAVAEREAPPWMQVLYNPLDFWPVVQRAYAAVRPERVVLIEAEVWPNLAAMAHARRIPLSLVNARLSPRSEGRFRKVRALMGPTFRCLDLVCAQEPADVERLASIGIRREVIHHVGSIKYDPLGAEIEPMQSLGLDTRPVLLGGSTHPGEEEVLAQAFLQLRREFTDLFLIVAPRHVERTGEVRQKLEALGLRVILRTELSDLNLTTEGHCLLLNTTGELRRWYAAATVVFVGKSLATHGGQNPVEPILAGRPVVFGPHMENFESLARALRAHDAAIQINEGEPLAPAIAELLLDPARRAQMIARAHEVLAPHRGATERTARLVLAAKSLAPR